MHVSNVIEGATVQIHFSDQKAKPLFSAENKQKAKTEANKRVIDFGVSANRLLSGNFAKKFEPETHKPDQIFLQRVLVAAGPELEPADFEAYATAQIRKMVRSHKEIVPGILISLAEQAARQLRDKPADESPAPAARQPLPPPAPLDPALPWDQVRRQLQAICSEFTYSNWFADTRQISAGKSSIVVAVGDEGIKLFLEESEELQARISEASAYVQQPSKIIWRVE